MARHRQHTREFKLAALARMDTAADVQALARELGVERSMLYRWQRTYIRGGAAALRSTGRPRPVLMPRSAATAAMAEPPPVSVAEAAANPAPVTAGAAAGEAPSSLAAFDPASAARRIAELEQKIGQQQLELDFFRAALRQVRASRR